MNIYDILLLIAVAAAFVLALLKIRRNRKKGKLCGGNCSCCSACSKCTEKK